MVTASPKLKGLKAAVRPSPCSVRGASGASAKRVKRPGEAKRLSAVSSRREPRGPGSRDCSCGAVVSVRPGLGQAPSAGIGELEL